MNQKILDQHPGVNSYAQLLGEHIQMDKAFEHAKATVEEILANPGDRSQEYLAELSIRFEDLDLVMAYSKVVVGLLEDIVELEAALTNRVINPVEIRGYVKEAIKQTKAAEKELALEREIAELIKYAQECKQGHVEMWEWLSQNPGADKSDWPGWGKFSNGIEPGYDSIRSSCFACEIAYEINSLDPKNGDFDDICWACPVTWASEGRDCLNGEFGTWVRVSLADKPKIAAEIRDKEWTLTINEKEITLGNEDERPAEVADRAA